MTFLKLYLIGATVAVSLLATAGNLVKNGDFASARSGWRVAAETGNEVTFADGECRYAITTAKKGSDGQIGQTLSLKVGVKYRFSGEMISSKAGVGYFQIKMLEGRAMKKALVVGRSTSEWKSFSQEFTAEASRLELICRFKQNPGLEGATGAFRNLSLTEAEGQTKTETQTRPAVAALRSASYVSPAGSGDRSGADEANAASSLNDAWDATAPGGTVHVLAGEYRNVTLTVTPANSGKEGAVKKLAGLNSTPVFIGDWNRNSPAAGRDFVKLSAGASHVAFENMHFESYRDVFISSGDNADLTFRNLEMRGIRDGIFLCGATKVLIEDCRMVGFSKRGVRLQDGCSDAVVRNVFADAGGREFATEPFQMCFAVGARGKAVDSRILFENCTALNAWHDAGFDGAGNPRYWNADGFCAESNTREITWRNCRAFGSTDGGWDIKTRKATLIDCVAFDNKRNFRIWSDKEEPAVMINCIGGSPESAAGTAPRRGFTSAATPAK